MNSWRRCSSSKAATACARRSTRRRASRATSTFSITTAIDAERMKSEIDRACEVAQAASGVQFHLGRNSLAADQMLDRERRSYRGRVYFQDFYGNADNVVISVRLDLTAFDRLFLDPV